MSDRDRRKRAGVALVKRVTGLERIGRSRKNRSLIYGARDLCPEVIRVDVCSNPKLNRRSPEGYVLQIEQMLVRYWG